MWVWFGSTGADNGKLDQSRKHGDSQNSTVERSLDQSVVVYVVGHDGGKIEGKDA